MTVTLSSLNELTWSILWLLMRTGGAGLDFLVYKETLLKFRYDVFTCPGNGKISTIVAIFKSIVIFDNDIAHGDINSRTHDFTKKQ